MDLNPDKNLFSVAPVGPIIVIGRHTALKGGITREYAVNLAACLIIAAKSNPNEIGKAIDDVMTGSASIVGIPQSVANVPASIVKQVTPYIGTVDAEEAASLVELARKQGPVMHQEEQTGRPVMRPSVPPPPKEVVEPIDLDRIARSWGAGNG